MQAFRSNTTVMIGLAVVFGGAAVFLARNWLEHQADLNASRQQATEQAPIGTLVVAAQPLHFGSEIGKSSLREIPWPRDSVPPGAYAKTDDLLSEGRHVVLSAMEPYEPILKGKITGPGQRAGLASLVSDGLRAVAVRVNDVNGVAGFVLPGDRVDIIMSQHDGNAASTSDIVLQSVRVLAIDQLADDQTDKPSVVKTVTIETTVLGAQKVSLASLVGTLSLTLRRAGDTAAQQTKRITLADLTRGDDSDAAAKTFMMSASQKEDMDVGGRDVTVRVTHASEATPKEYVVPSEKYR